MKNKTIVICTTIFILSLIVGIFAPLIAPHNPYLVDVEQKFLEASQTYLLGTDHLGRCIFSRILYGLRSTLILSLCVSLVSMALGLVIGITIALSNRWIEMGAVKFFDILNSFPRIITVLIIINILGPSSFSLGLAIASTKWILYAKIARNLTKVLKEKEFVLASYLLGTNRLKIIIFELIPNIFPKIISVFTIDFGNIVLSIAGYSFLGFGAKPPHAELGMMLNEGRSYIYSNFNIMLWPGVVIFLLVFNINILGDKLNYKLEDIKD